MLQGIEQLEPCIIPFQEGKSQFTCQYKMNVLIAYTHNITYKLVLICNFNLGQAAEQGRLGKFKKT